MKLMSTASDALGVDPRTKGTPRPTSDNSSNDNSSQQFDGVLSDVGSDAKPSAATDSGKTKVAAPAAATLANLPDTASPGSTIIDALAGLLGNGTGAAAAAAPTDVKGAPKAKTSDDDADGADGVDSLLKRMAAKDATAPDPQSPAAPVPAGASADVMSMLLLGAGVQKAPQPQAAIPATSVAATTETAAMVGALDPKAKATAADTPTSTDPKEMIVTDVAVSTHLPPAQPVQNKAVPSDGAKGAPTQSLNRPAPAVGGAHARADDSAALGHTAEASTSAAALPSTSMGANFGPARSIATAIAELAAAPAPAPVSATPEPAKAAIGIARTMTLQMNPADLGTIDIRLHMTGQTLDVQLTVANSKTLGIVNRDRDTLASALHDQNYSLNSLVIQDGGAAASSGGHNGTQGDTSGSNARAERQSSGAGSDAQSGGRQGSGAGRPTQDDRRPRSDAPSRPAVADSRSGSLYV